MSFTLARSAGTNGCETPQIYLGYPNAAADEKIPTKVLRYFKKSCSESERISYQFTDRDVSNWDAAAKEWKVTEGEFKVYVCVSSQECPFKGAFSV
eukprot:SAG31_NODE_3247_length_4493_cov_3.475876_1_plen_96_part_00